MECLCDACPSLRTSLAKFFGTMMEVLSVAFSSSIADQQKMQNTILKSVCYLHDGFSCLNSHAVCDGMADLEGMDLSSLTNDLDALKKQCEEKGYELGESGGTTWTTP